MGSRSVICHPAAVTFMRLPQQKLVLDLAIDVKNVQKKIKNVKKRKKRNKNKKRLKTLDKNRSSPKHNA